MQETETAIIKKNVDENNLIVKIGEVYKIFHTLELIHF